MCIRDRRTRTLKTAGVTSSVSSTQSVSTCAASTIIAAFDPTKHAESYLPVVTKRSAETLPSTSAVAVGLQPSSKPTTPVATPRVTSSVSSTQSVSTCAASTIIAAFDPTEHAESYLPVVTKRFAETLPSTSAVAVGLQPPSKPTRPVATPRVTSSVSSTQSVITCASSTITECDPTKRVSLSVVRPVKVQYDSNCVRIQDSANVHNIYERLGTVEQKPKPVNYASDAVPITQPTVEHATQSVEPSKTSLFPNTTLPHAAAPASKFQSTARTSEQPAESAIANTSVKLGKVCSSSVATHEETVKSTSSAVRYTPDSRASNDRNVPIITSTSSTSLLLHRSLNYKQSVGDTMPPSTESTGTCTKQTDEHSQFPLSHEYEFRIVCVMCFKPNTELMLPVRTHSCRQDVLAVKKTGTRQWHWIRQRKPYIQFKGDYAMCFKRQNGNSCYSGCTYAHCDAERQLWNMEKYSTFSTDKFIIAHRTSAPLCNVKNLLHKHPVSRSSCFPSLKSMLLNVFDAIRRRIRFLKIDK